MGGGDDGLRVIRRTVRDGQVQVYNLEVDIDRTYVVASTPIRGPPRAVWVHNDNCVLRRQIERQITKHAQDLGYTLTEAQKLLAIDELVKRAASGGGRGVFVKGTRATATPDTTVNRLINRIELTEGDRGIRWVRETPTKDSRVLAYERKAEGSLLDAISGESVVPVLPFAESRAGVVVNDFKKFDGVKRAADGSLTKTLIDRKLVNAWTVQKSGFVESLRKMILCLNDPANRAAGFTCVIEVPSEVVRGAIEKLVQTLGGSGVITVMKVGP